MIQEDNNNRNQEKKGGEDDDDMMMIKIHELEKQISLSTPGDGEGDGDGNNDGNISSLINSYNLHLHIVQLYSDSSHPADYFQQATTYLNLLKNIYQQILTLSTAATTSSSIPENIRELEWNIFLCEFFLQIQSPEFIQAEAYGINLIIQRLLLDKKDSLHLKKILKYFLILYKKLERKNKIEYLNELIKYMNDNLQNNITSYATLQFLNDLALDDYIQYSNLYANVIFQFLVTFSQQHLPPNDITTTRYMNNYGEYLRAMRRYEESVKLHLEAFHIREKLTQKQKIDSLFLAESSNNLGLGYRFMGDYHSAEKYLLKALNIRIEKFQTNLNRPLLASTYNQLAELYRDMKQLKKALENHEIAIEIYTKLYGSYHPTVMNTQASMGITYQYFASVCEELGHDLIHKTREIFIHELRYSLDHPWVLKLSTEINLKEANECYLRHEYQAALEKYDLILTEKQRTHESNEVIHKISRKYFETMYQYAAVELFEIVEDYQQGKEILEVCARESNKYFQEEERFSYQVRILLAVSLRLNGDVAASIADFEKMLTNFSSKIGSTHPMIAEVSRQLGLCYLEQGNQTLSLSYFTQARNILEKVIQEGFHDTLCDKNSNNLLYANTLSDLSELCRKMGNFADGITHQLKAKEIRQFYLPDNDVALGDSNLILGELYCDENDDHNAQIYSNKAQQIYDKVYQGKNCTPLRLTRLSQLKETIQQLQKDKEITTSPEIALLSDPVHNETQLKYEELMKMNELILTKLVELENIYTPSSVNSLTNMATSNQTPIERLDHIIDLAMQNKQHFLEFQQSTKQTQETTDLELKELQLKIINLENAAAVAAATVATAVPTPAPAPAVEDEKDEEEEQEHEEQATPLTKDPSNTEILGYVTTQFFSRLHLEVACRAFIEKLSNQTLTDDLIARLSHDLNVSQAEVKNLENIISCLNTKVATLDELQKSQTLHEQDILQFNKSLIQRLEQEIHQLEGDQKRSNKEIALYEQNQDRLQEEIQAANNSLIYSQNSTQFFSQLFMNLAVMIVSTTESHEEKELVEDHCNYISMQSLNRVHRQLEEKSAETLELQTKLFLENENNMKLKLNYEQTIHSNLLEMNLLQQSLTEVTDEKNLKITQLEVELSTLNHQLNDLQRSVTTKDLELIDLMSLLKTNQNELSNQQLSSNLSSQRIIHLEEEINQLKQSKVELQQQAEISQQETVSALRKFAHVLESVQEEKSRLRDESEAKISQLTSQIQIIECSNLELTHHLTQSRSLQQECHNENLTLRELLSQTSNSLQLVTQDLNSLRVTKLELEEEQSEIENNLSIMFLNLSKLQRDFESLTDLNNEIQQSNSLAVTQFELLINDRVDQIKQLNDENKQLLTSQLNLEMSLKSTSEELSALISSNQLKIREYDNKLFEMNQRYELCTQEYEQQKQVLERELSVANHTIHEQSDSLIQLNLDYEENNERLTKECQQLVVNLDAMIEQNKSHESHIGNLEFELTELKNNSIALRNEYEDMKVQMHDTLDVAHGREMDLIKKLTDVESVNASQSLSLESNQLEIETLQMKLSTLQHSSNQTIESLQQAQQDLSQLQFENNSLKNQIIQLNDEVMNLKDELDYIDVDSPLLFTLKQENVRLLRNMESENTSLPIIENLKQNIEITTQELLSTQQKLEVMTNKSLYLEMQIHELETNNDTLVKERDRLVVENKNYQDMEEMTEKSIFETWSTIFNTESKYLNNSISSEINDLPDIIEIPDNIVSPRFDKSHSYLHEIPKLVHNLETNHFFQIQQLQDKFHSEHQLVLTISEERTKLTNEFHQLTEIFQNLKSSHEKLLQEHYHCEQNKNLRVELNEMQVNYENIKRSYELLLETYEKLRHESDIQSSEMEEMSDNLKMSESNNNRLLKENTRLLETIQETQQLYEETTHQLNETNDKNRILQNEMMTIEKINKELVSKMKKYDEDRLSYQKEFEQLQLSEIEVKKQLQRLNEQRKLLDPWGFCREMSMGYKRFHQTTAQSPITQPPSYDSLDSASGGGYRGAKSLKSSTTVLPFSDDEDEDKSYKSKKILSTHADELVLGGIPSRNFVAVKSSHQSDRSVTPLTAFFSPGGSKHHSDDLEFDDCEDDYLDYPHREGRAGGSGGAGAGDECFPITRKSSKLPSPSKPKDSHEIEKIFCPRDPNKLTSSHHHNYNNHNNQRVSEEDQNESTRRIQTADGNLSRRVKKDLNTYNHDSQIISIASKDPSHRLQSAISTSPTSISDKISPLSSARTDLHHHQNQQHHQNHQHLHQQQSQQQQSHQQLPSPLQSHSTHATRPSKIPKKVKVVGNKSTDEEFSRSSISMSYPTGPSDILILHLDESPPSPQSTHSKKSLDGGHKTRKIEKSTLSIHHPGLNSTSKRITSA